MAKSIRHHRSLKITLALRRSKSTKHFLTEAINAKLNGDPIPPFPEDAFDAHLDNTWGDTAKGALQQLAWPRLQAH